MSIENPQFLHKKYQDLNTSEEVDSAAHRTNVRAEGNDALEEVSTKPAERIQNYLDRFQEIIDRPDEAKRERGLEALKQVLHDKFVIKPEGIPESAFLLEQRIARNMGHGDVPLTEEFRQLKTQEIVNNQTRSLDLWINELSSPDAPYDDWVKYWAFRSMLEMGKFEKKTDPEGNEVGSFTRRTPDTAASFPLMNPRALGLVVQVVTSKLEQTAKPKADRQPIPNASTKLSDQTFQNLLANENFSKLYAQFLIELPAYSREGLQETRGTWIKYDQGSEPETLTKSLEGYPLEWCTANPDTARTQLQGGDFYVYYSINEDGEPKIPRVAIRMEGDHIAEVRGIAPDQETDPYITDVIAAKLPDFGPTEADSYSQKVHDMKLMTTIETKVKKDEPLTQQDLIFLYEIDQTIESFAHNGVRDPRIAELRATRNPREDAPIVLDCEPDQIAWKQADITETTKAYIGPLFPGIFQQLPSSVEHLYTSFLEGKVDLFQAGIGGKTKEQLLDELKSTAESKGLDRAELMLKSEEFSALPKSELIDLVRLSVKDLGFDSGATIDKIYKRSEELGLELCPAEVGPHLRSQDMKQKLFNRYYIAMKQISYLDGNPLVYSSSLRDGSPLVFSLEQYADGLWLGGRTAKPYTRWDSDNRFVFRRRKEKKGV